MQDSIGSDLEEPSEASAIQEAFLEASLAKQTVEAGRNPLVYHWLLIKPWRASLAATTITAIAVTFIAAEFLLPQWYQSTAVLRPASQQGPVSPLATMLGNSSVGQMLGSVIGSSTGLSNQLPPDAAEYLDMLTSYNFTVALVQKHDLGRLLEAEGIHPIRQIRKTVFAFLGINDFYESEKRLWDWYEDMQDRFSCDYDTRQGSLTISFVAKNPAAAKATLEFYIEDLRALLRQRTIQSTSAAIKSLQQERERTADPQIQEQLAQIIAQQIQQEKTAQAQADFAFSVTEPPYVPLEVYKPNTLLLCVLVAIIVPFIFVSYVEFQANIIAPVSRAHSKT
jgi:uncharacterized protein involved in exopolysaccharide biosynthesis